MNAPTFCPRVAQVWVGALIAIGVGIIFWFTVDPGQTAMRLLQGAHILGYLVAILTLRRHRYLLFVVVLLVTLSGWLLNITQEPFIVAAWSLYRTARLAPTQKYFVPSFSAVSILFVVLLFGGQAPSSEVLLLQVLMSMTALFAAWILGVQGRKEADQREQTTRARERAALLEERAKVSRELHDVLSHTLSRIGLKAGVAAEIDTDGSERSLRVLREIESTSRSALNDVRNVLARVRTEELEADTPTLADLSALVDRSRSSGIEATANIQLDCDSQTPVSIHLYRIVQELLTNIGKHAPRGVGQLTVEKSGSEIRVRADNPIDPPVEGFQPGLGIIGIRERTELIGGTCDVTVDSRFVVEVTMPASVVGHTEASDDQ